MQIKYSTQGNLDFVNNWYVLAFDLNCTDAPQTCEPYAKDGNQLQNYHNWDFEIIVGQFSASSTVQAQLWQFLSQQTANGTQKVPQRVPLGPQDIVINPNCNGNQTTFCLTIFRRVFNGIAVGANPTPGPANGPGGVWYINWFVASPQPGANGAPTGTPVWAPGQQGINDTTFQYPDGNPGLEMTQTFDIPWTALLPPTWQSAPTPSAQVTGGEVNNNP